MCKLMHAVGLDDSLLISHVVNKEVLAFQTGSNSSVWSDLEVMKRFPVGVKYKVVVELVVMNIYCFIFVFSLFICNNEYILIISNQCILLCKLPSNYLYPFSRKFKFPFMDFGGGDHRL